MDQQAFAQMLGNYGEFFGAIAVFITLVYLAVQVGHARVETRRALGQSRAESNRELIRLGLEDGNLRAHMKADMSFATEPLGITQMLMSRAGLTREEASRVTMVYLAYWNYVVQMVTMVESFSKPERDLFDSFIGNRYRRPGTYGEIYQAYTKRAQPHSEVVAYVDAILEKG